MEVIVLCYYVSAYVLFGGNCEILVVWIVRFQKCVFRMELSYRYANQIRPVPVKAFLFSIHNFLISALGYYSLWLSQNCHSEKRKYHVLSTTVQILDVITSFNCNCRPTAAILFRYRSNGSHDFPVSICLEVTSHQTFRVRLAVTLWRHLSQPYTPYSIETKDVITSKNSMFYLRQYKCLTW
jgi:hypothetical protein